MYSPLSYVWWLSLVVDHFLGLSWFPSSVPFPFADLNLYPSVVINYKKQLFWVLWVPPIKTWGGLSGVGGEGPSVQEGTQFQLYVLYRSPCGCYNFSIEFKIFSSYKYCDLCRGQLSFPGHLQCYADAGLKEVSNGPPCYLALVSTSSEMETGLLPNTHACLQVLWFLALQPLCLLQMNPSF